jgi:outer membrane immunogenic protein
MKRFGLGFLAAALSFGLGGLAEAADISRPLPPAPPPVMAPAPVVITNFTGCYVGANLGGTWGNRHFYDVTTSPIADGGSHGATGFVGGGQLGCDYQMNMFVIGFQGMFDGAVAKGHHNKSGTDFWTNVDWFGAATGRVGIAAVSNALFYFKGGWAWAHDRYNIDNDFKFSVTRNGWTLGGGVEWMFAPGWSVFAEYNYFNLGSATRHFTTPSALSAKVSQNMQVALIGVNLRFGAVPGRY